MAGLFQKPFNVDSREAAEGVEALGECGAREERRGEERRGEKRRGGERRGEEEYRGGGREGGREEGRKGGREEWREHGVSMQWRGDMHGYRVHT